MKVRLVAYRKATTSATVDSSYELDLLKEPNISLNYQFDDVKNPEKRKTNFSQTFKLPFTNNNNKFFQDWYNVNADTLVFDTRVSFNAVLYAGGVSQFDGILQLKCVYKNAQYYQVSLLSNSADLFTVIGSNKLKDIFKEADGGYSEDLDHTYNEANLKASWDGASSDFENIAGTSLRDADSGVQKVMYPFSFTQPTAEYDASGNNMFIRKHLALTDAASYSSQPRCPITQFRPAIQIKELFKRIFSQAGFSYTSSFIDGDYFGKLFMTTCNHTSLPRPQMKPPTGVSGVCVVGNNEPWGNFVVFNDYTVVDTWQQFKANQVTPISSSYPLPGDINDCWDEVNSIFTKTSAFQGAYNPEESNWNNISITLNITATNTTICSFNLPSAKAKICKINDDGTIDWDTIYAQSIFDVTLTQNESSTVGVDYYTVTLELYLSNMDVGDRGKIYISIDNWCRDDNSIPASMQIGAAATDQTYGCYGLFSLSWSGLSTLVYDEQVLVPDGIDPSITQKAFLKDIIERFNLVFLSDPDDPSNIIIETYNDYLAAGSIKNWTDKIDTLKETVVKDTTSLQKKEIEFTDLEDEDIVNKSIKEEQFELNVYGKYTESTFSNDFAKGTLKNNSIFSPYINEKIFVNEDTTLPTQLSNVAAHYEFSYELIEGGSYENKLKATKPKLFYYCGTPTTLINAGINSTPTMYMHHSSPSSTPDTYSFQAYPLCSPYELTPNATGISSITTSTKSLYWGAAPPRCPQLLVFNSANGIVTQNGLYNYYWSNYLNSIYAQDSRIMECYLNLNEVDILNFKFNDEIYIKDSYWRILKLQNYQVGTNTSTKAILLKVNQSYDGTCYDCDYVLGSIGNYNTWDGYYVWCPPGTPNCTPNITTTGTTNLSGIYANTECCDCMGGYIVDVPPLASWGIDASLRPCMSNANSLPAWIQSQRGQQAFFSNTNAKNLLSGKLAGKNIPFVIGTNNTRTSAKILPYNGDDFVIKFKNRNTSTPFMEGESHKMVLTGYTSGSAIGYAYPQGKEARNINIPTNSNMIIKVKGTTSVVGGTNVTYPIGSTEAFSWYTAFKNVAGTVTQIGTAGGVQDFNISEGTPRTSLQITGTDAELKFGLSSGLGDVKRVWSLTIDITVQLIDNMSIGYGENWALYQNGDIIQLQNMDFLKWN